MSYRTAEAETLALRALAWIAGSDDLFLAFMGATGASSEDVRKAAADPAFLGAVLDFLLSDEGTVIAFCKAESLPFDSLMQARAALPGGEVPHWT